jgi:predicted DNA-binding helix-hairpin-helix protein
MSLKEILSDEISIAVLNINKNTIVALALHKIFVVSQLEAMAYNDVIKIPGIGHRQIIGLIISMESIDKKLKG